MRKENISAIILAAIASAGLLSGCKKESKIIEKDGNTYIKSGSDYVELDLEPKVFKPGEHIIYYVTSFKVETTTWSGYYSISPGYGNSNLPVPEIPEGYSCIDIIDIVDDNNKGATSVIFYYINDVEVEAEGRYNTETNTVDYPNPGKVLSQELTLK